MSLIPLVGMVGCVAWGARPLGGRVDVWGAGPIWPWGAWGLGLAPWADIALV